MKSIQKLFLSVLLLSFLFISCSSDDGPDDKKEYDKVAYIVNYGVYGKGNGEISIFDTEKHTINQNAFKAANGVDFSSNIQSIAIYEDMVYLMTNSGDKIDVLDAKTLKAAGNPVSGDIIKPRYFTAKDNKAYISCWGNVDDWSVMAHSYIAKMDLTSKAITKIALPGGPEGVIISNNKLYVALSTVNKVAVISLSTNNISYIDISAVPQQFVEDVNGKIWVSMVSKYSTPFPTDQLGLAVIDPATDQVIADVKFSGMGSDGMIAITSDKKTIYAMGAEAWPGTATTIYAVDAVNKTIASTALITGEKFNGLGVNPENNDIYVLTSPSATEAGTMKVYTSNGGLLLSKETGLSPKHIVFYAIEK
jgi:hypothetical protein